eukprot:9375608-Pyramimonas_sp.AAC.1
MAMRRVARLDKRKGLAESGQRQGPSEPRGTTLMYTNTQTCSKGPSRMSTFLKWRLVFRRPRRTRFCGLPPQLHGRAGVRYFNSTNLVKTILLLWAEMTGCFVPYLCHGPLLSRAVVLKYNLKDKPLRRKNRASREG